MEFYCAQRSLFPISSFFFSFFKARTAKNIKVFRVFYRDSLFKYLKSVEILLDGLKKVVGQLFDFVEELSFFFKIKINCLKR